MCRPRVIRLSLDDPETLRLVRNGAIWDYTGWWQKGVDAIESGLVHLDQCERVPEMVRDFLTRQ